MGPNRADLDRSPVAAIRDALLSRQRFLITSHASPDGDSIGSQLAMAYALQALGRQVHLVNRDAAPPHYLEFPGVASIEVADRVEGDYDALIVMECSDLARPGVAGLERYFIVNIDHHVGNTLYGALNWHDVTAAACGEMVYDLIGALGVPVSPDIGFHLYLAIVTDTGSFRHSNITARTFEVCRRAAEAGVDAAGMARRLFENSSAGRLRLIGALLESMELANGGTVAVLYLDDAIMEAAGCAPSDTDGVINMPLSAREVQAVVFFKRVQGVTKVSLRSKGEIDVRSVALRFGGGGHKNAAGFTLTAPVDDLRATVVREVAAAIGGIEP